ncbi:hypothetical protein [Metalysinibacillus jejuensis]|uniref:hypothetical protein n=1 Tax=Metalysinibacillus jejuensis TaxID=914327 RepID=UPI000D38CE52|nr:hypothetical protein [Metalysinibacillus jejuensis]
MIIEASLTTQRKFEEVFVYASLNWSNTEAFKANVSPAFKSSKSEASVASILEIEAGTLPW